MHPKYHHSSTLLYVPSAKTNLSTDDQHPSLLDVPPADSLPNALAENDALRREVRRLEALLQVRRGFRGGERMKSEGREEDQSKRFKNIIEKSYYSLREMEKEIQRLKKTIQENTVSLQALQHEFRMVSIENQTLTVKLREAGENHRGEMEASNERILRLEGKMEKLMGVMEEWEEEWRREREELQQAKKFYFKRTA